MTADERAEDLSWPEDAVEVGRILGAWGIKGGIKVAPFAADPQALFSAKRWFLKPAESAKPPSAKSVAAAAAKPAPAAAPSRKTPAQQAALAAPLPVALHVKGVRDQGDAIVATAPEIPDRDAAEAMKGVRIFVSRASFPAPDEDEFYWVDLIGLSVVNRDGAALGEVVGLIDTGPHCVLRVQPPAEASAPAPDAAKPGAAKSGAPASDVAAEERLIPFVEAYVDQVDMPGRRIVVDWGLDF
ncbi:MAG: ribosome maturation factor RimM [Burkholderiaceae bacterium]